jgi:hypothetical protein
LETSSGKVSLRSYLKNKLKTKGLVMFRQQKALSSIPSTTKNKTKKPKPCIPAIKTLLEQLPA